MAAHHHLGGHRHIQSQPTTSGSSSPANGGSPPSFSSSSPPPPTTTGPLQLDKEFMHARHYRMLVDCDITGLRDELSSSQLANLLWELDDSTALHIAASAGHLDLITLLLDQIQALCHCRNSSGDLPIHVGARGGHVYVVRRLVDSVKDQQVQYQMLQQENHDKNTALHIALENRHEEMARYLFEKCPLTFYRLNDQEISPLYLAIKAGFWKLVIDMLQLEVSDSDVERELLRGRSVVHAAIMTKNLEILTIMCKNYDDLILNSFDEKGRTPLSYAAYIGFIDGVKYMLNQLSDEKPGIAFNVNNDGSFPIHTACSGGNLQVVKEFFLHSRYMSCLLNKKKQNILHVAAASGKAEVVKYLLKRRDLGNLVNMKDEDGNTPLHLATMGKHAKVVYILTWDERVEVDAQNKDGLMALDMAEEYGETPSFEERLTWLALRYAGAKRAPQVHVDTDTNTVGVNMVLTNPNGVLVHNSIPAILEARNQNGPAQQYRPKHSGKKYKDRVNTLLVVSTLVATVTFASGFTVPGGYNNSDPNQGMATLARRRAFQVFVISNTVAMYSSILAAVTLIWAHLDDLKLTLVSLDFAMPLLGTALAMMSVAFVAGLYAVLPTVFWLGVVVLVMGGFCLGFLLVFFIPLYLPTSSVKYRVLRYVFHVPFMLMLLACEKGKDEYSF